MSDLIEALREEGRGSFPCPSCGSVASDTYDYPFCPRGCSPTQMLVAIQTRPEKCPEDHSGFGARNPASKCLTCQREIEWVRREARRLVAQADDDGSGWTATNLTEAPDVPPPMILEIGEGSGDYLFRRGWVTLIHGRFASAKTPVTYLAVVEQVRAGRGAIIVDYEMGQSGAVALLREMGLCDGQIERHVHYIERPPPMSPAGARRIAQDLADKGMDDIAVVVIDSLTQSMATVPGADDNRALDVTVWADELPWWFAQEFNAAVLIIDHSNISDGNRPSGSHKKREFPQFHLWCRLDVPFSREKPEAGKATLIVMKDRSGERVIEGEVAVMRTRPGGSFYVTAPEPTKHGEVDLPLDQQPEGSTDEEVYRDLVLAGPDGLLKTHLTGRGARGTYRRHALDRLIEEGRAVERADPASSRARRCWADINAP